MTKSGRKGERWKGGEMKTVETVLFKRQLAKMVETSLKSKTSLSK